MNKQVVVIAAHPDDEILGCGATIAKHVKQGDEVHVLILAEGLTSRDINRDRKKNLIALSELGMRAQEANRKLGVSSVVLHDYPDNRMDSLALLDVIKVVESFLNQHRPAIVYTHHHGDLNIDHKITHSAVTTACRPLPGQFVKSLLFFEVASSTEWQTTEPANCFSPNWFVDVSETLDVKLEALEVYATEMRQWPHARSIQAVRHLAHWRGATIGVDSAEAFVVGRCIE